MLKKWLKKSETLPSLLTSIMVRQHLSTLCLDLVGLTSVNNVLWIQTNLKEKRVLLSYQNAPTSTTMDIKLTLSIPQAIMILVVKLKESWVWLTVSAWLFVLLKVQWLKLSLFSEKLLKETSSHLLLLTR